MRALVQRVSRASVRVGGETVGAIDGGLLILLGVTHDDGEATADALARKALGLRLFDDGEGRMNRDLAQAGGAVLCVSQFTLYADTRRGRRPSFTEAAEAALAERLWERFCDAIERAGVRCERGRFGAHGRGERERRPRHAAARQRRSARLTATAAAVSVGPCRP